MKNLTLAVEEEVLREARKVALEHNTTVNRLIRDYLKKLIAERSRKRGALQRLRERMALGLYRVGDRDWQREDLYERER